MSSDVIDLDNTGNGTFHASECQWIGIGKIYRTGNRTKSHIEDAKKQVFSVPQKYEYDYSHRLKFTLLLASSCFSSCGKYSIETVYTEM